MTLAWRTLDYEEWSDTCDTLHAHTQLLGKIAARLSPAEPGVQHAALRLTARGWETAPLPAPDGSGALGVCLDLRGHEAVVEHSDGRERRLPLAPARSVADVAHELLAAVRELGGELEINPTPQEVHWSVPLDEDREHATYDTRAVQRYFGQATLAALTLAAFAAPHAGRRTPVNAWWGSFDIAVNMSMESPTRELAVGWWPGDPRHPRAAFYGYFKPGASNPRTVQLEPPQARWDDPLGEFVLDHGDVCAAADPRATVLAFARSVQTAAG